MTPPVEPAVWRGGVHLSGTEIWCDAPRRRELCFVSAIDAVGAIRHGQLLATVTTLGLLRGHRRSPLADSELAVPVGRPFTLGELRLELFASGHALGSAALKVEHPNGTAVIYAGAVDPRPSPLAGPADVRRADALIVSGRYGHPRYRFPPLAEAAGELAARLEAIRRRGGAAVLEVDGESQSLDLVAALDLDEPILTSRRLYHLARAARQLGHSIPRTRELRRPLAPGDVALVSPERAPRELPAESEVIRCGPGAEVVISDRADFLGLLDYIEQTGAARVLVTEKLEPELAEALAGRGVRATLLGPAQQLELPV